MNDTSNQEFPDIDNNNALAATRSAIVAAHSTLATTYQVLGFGTVWFCHVLLIVEQQS